MTHTKINLKIKTESKIKFDYSDPSKLSFSKSRVIREETRYRSSCSRSVRVRLQHGTVDCEKVLKDLFLLYHCCRCAFLSVFKSSHLRSHTRWLNVLRRPRVLDQDRHTLCRNQCESCKCSSYSYWELICERNLPNDYGARRLAVQAKFKPEIRYTACSIRINACSSGKSLNTQPC